MTVALDPVDREAVAGRWAATGGPPDRITLAPVGATSVAAEIALGRADLGVLYGDAVTGLETDGTVTLERARRWDRLWVLWVADRGSWVVDPAFRRWLFASIRTEGWPALLFGGHADSVHPAPTVARRPFDERSRPNLTLVAPPHASRLASRLQAELDAVGVELDVGLDARAPASLRLVEVRGQDDDPLALLSALAAYDRRIAMSRVLRLGHASTEIEAAEYERSLLVEGRAVGLVREHAWVARTADAKRVRLGAHGEIDASRRGRR